MSVMSKEDMSENKPEESTKDDSRPNGGFPHGIQFPTSEMYYGADAVRRNSYGLLEWYTVFPAYNRIGRQCEDGIVLFDFNPGISLEQFKALSGCI